MSKFVRCINFLLMAMVCGCSSEKKHDWYQEEILVQLQELKQEVRSLRKDVSSLAKGRDRGFVKKSMKISLKNSPSINDDARFAIVEFSDFQCPYCARHERNVFPEIKKKFLDSGILRYVVRDFPLAFHSQARSAAMVAHCAGDQGEYWGMRNFLFHSTGLSEEVFKAGANELNLDVKEFSDCLTSNKYANRVESDYQYGQEIGVNGTPRFYAGRVDGDYLIDIVPLSGAQPFPAFERVIENFINEES